MNNNYTIKNKFTVPKKIWKQKLWLSSLIIYAIAEGLYAIFQFYAGDIPSHKHTNEYYLFQCLVNVIMTTTLWFILYQFNNNKTTIILITNLTVFVVWYFLRIAIKYYLQNHGPLGLSGNANEIYTIKNIVYDSWFDIGGYMLIATAFYMLKFYEKHKKAAEQRMQLTMINKDMQLKLLNQQLNPHFYFNTLNNLYGLARRNSFKLSETLQQLQVIMDYVITECDNKLVPLQKEIDFLKSYIALEQLRYEENIAIDVQIQGNANGYNILPMLLIQFVENAFKHGMKEKSHMNWMKVELQTRNETLFFAVNNSCLSHNFTEGVGLSSVKHRLNLQYDGKHNIQILNTAGTFSVSLQLNLS